MRGVWTVGVHHVLRYKKRIRCMTSHMEEVMMPLIDAHPQPGIAPPTPRATTTGVENTMGISKMEKIDRTYLQPQFP